MSYLKLSGSTDLTSYIQEYEYTKNPVELTSKNASTGFRTRKIGEHPVGVIKVKFRPGLSAADVSTILSVLMVDDKGLFEFWDLEGNKARKAYFYVTVDNVRIPPGGICDTFSATLEQADAASDVNETIVTSFPSSHVDKSNSWSNETNAYADDPNYATNAGTTGVSQLIYFSGFSWVDGNGDPVTIPEGATLNYIEIDLKYKVSSASSIIVVTMAPAYKNTERGTVWYSKNEPTDEITETGRFSAKGWTIAQLADAQIKLSYLRQHGTACLLSVNYVKMRLSYTVND